MVVNCSGCTKKTEYKESELNPEWNEVPSDKCLQSLYNYVIC